MLYLPETLILRWFFFIYEQSNEVSLEDFFMAQFYGNMSTKIEKAAKKNLIKSRLFQVYTVYNLLTA